MSEPDGLPSYLAIDASGDPAQRSYGTLSYNQRRNCWVVKADPSVTEFCKRLFPGTATDRRGEARFTAHRRIIGDLNWLMMRYPLTVRPRDAARWQEALHQAREYVRVRQAAQQAPQRISPSAQVFTGQLTTFQQEGLAFLLRTDRCLLADEMGLGKTVQTLAMFAQLDAYPALIVAPAHLMRNWQSEIMRFLRRRDGRAPSVHIIKGLTPYALPEADLYLLH
ncbi:MAG: hypothetical protein LLF96_13395, partial [Eubacteriales bacterium]|nr:hypothetical protein [Eubacteriales bacterium]